MRTITKKHQESSQSGFTLIEMAIVISIVGLIIASAGTAYVQWQTWLRYETTQNNVQAVHEAVEGFLATNGRYPCPASLSAGRADGTIYGLEPTGAASCNTVVAGNIDIAGSPPGVDIFIAAGARPGLNHVNNDGTPGVGPQIRIGMIPFRALGLDEEVAFDGYRNRIYYAVTDHMTSSDGFDNGMTGAIRVEDDDGNPLTNVDDIHFLVFSAGENGAGAFTREGAQLPCPAAGNAENENCDLNDAVFRLGSYSTSLNANAMDDTMTFGVSALPFFQRPEGGDLNDGVTKSALDLGIGGVADDPQEELDIAGAVRAVAPEDDPATTDIDESELGGKIEAAELCANGSDQNCFDIEVIAGSVGMECSGTGNFMIGIRNNAPVCGTITTGCPPNDYIVGIDDAGNAVCASASANPPCPTEQVPLCGSLQTLAAGLDGETRTVTAGDSRQQVYTCDSGTWRPDSPTGLCICTPTNPYTGTIPCAVNNDTCGPRFTGTQEAQITEVTCPAGNRTTTILDDSRCVCDPTSRRTSSRNCQGAGSWWLNLLSSPPPSGFSYNTGRIHRENVTICPAAACSGWRLDRENCGCTNRTQTQTRSCQNGFSGQRTRTRGFVCAGGGGLGDYGRWNDWSAWDESGCTCDTSGVTTGLIRCQEKQAGWQPKSSGPGGIRTETRRANVNGACVSQTTELDALRDVCDPPPPVQCAWRAGGSSAPGSHPSNFAGIPGGCTCGSGNAPCEQGSLRFNSCSCDPI